MEFRLHNISMPPIEVLFAATPNGWKVTIMLEELREAGVNVEYEVKSINMGQGDQFEDWFKAVNPNSKIPAIVDDGFAVFESGAILHYLAEKYGRLLPAEHEKKWEVLMWLHWQMANVGPMYGQKLSYTRYIQPEHPHPIERYGKESRRLAEVLDAQLEGKEYVCGEFSIADIALYPWIRGWKWSKVDLTGQRTEGSWPRVFRRRVRAAGGWRATVDSSVS